MADYFYQIKAKQDSGYEYARWIWPPVFSGKVTAPDKKAARKMVDEEYGQKFPMRVLNTDIESANFLLSITQISDGDKRTIELFEDKICKCCGQGFQVINHYNNAKQKYAGRDFCSDDCVEAYKKEHDSRLFAYDNLTITKNPPVIYKIENKKTGKVYIGQTCQTFTLRWWQHFAHPTTSKFHQEIKESSISDWIFSVIETIDISLKPPEKTNADFICDREQFYINQYDSINQGYNSATSRKEELAKIKDEIEMFEGL